jgi:hypothetical protein
MSSCAMESILNHYPINVLAYNYFSNNLQYEWHLNFLNFKTNLYVRLGQLT